MCAAGRVPLMIILIFGWSRPGMSACKSGWIPYEPDQSCIMELRYNFLWTSANSKCKLLKAGNIVIMHKDKAAFIKSQKSFAVRHHWIGITDFDRDGTYTHHNGSIVESYTPGLGNWTTEKWTRTSPRCVVISGTTFLYTDCKKYRWSICEYFLKPYVDSDSTTCTLENCPCKREAWTAYKPGLKYIKPNHVLATFADSVRICEKLGGQLLTVFDEGTHSFVKGISSSWSPTGVAYWTGLQFNVNHWRWTIDKKTYPFIFGTWFAGNWLKRGCAAIVWNYAGHFRPWDCRYKLYQVCETKDPCRAHPILTVDGVQVNPQGNIFVSKSDLAQSVTVKCSAKGYIPSINTTTFICFGMTESKTGTMEVNETIVVDDTWHDKRCTCRVILNDGKNKQESFRINYLIPPRLKKTETESTYEAPIGGYLYAKIDLIANPEPTTVDVIRHESGDNLEGFNYTIKPCKETRHYLLTLKIKTFLEMHIGNYTLRVGNGIQKSMFSTISLRAKKVKPKEDESSQTLILTVLLVLVVSWTSIMIFSLSGNKGDDDEDQGSESDSDSAQDIRVEPANLKSMDFSKYDYPDLDEQDDEDQGSESANDNESVQDLPVEQMHKPSRAPSVMPENEDADYVDDEND